MAALAVVGMLSAVIPAVSQRCRQRRNASEIRVIPEVFPRQQGVNRMMEINAPMGVDSVNTPLSISKEARIVHFPLRDQVERATKSSGQVSDRRLEFCQEMTGAKVKDSVDSIQAKGVEVVVFEPIQGVLDEESPDFVAAFAVKIDSLTPGSSIAISKVRPVSTKVIAFRPQMVVNHVEGDGQTLLVSGIYQSLEGLWATVGVLRSKHIYAVVSPISGAGKLCDGHQFNRRHTQGG